MKRLFVEIVERKTNLICRRIAVEFMRGAERVKTGIEMSIDRAHYFVRIV